MRGAVKSMCNLAMASALFFLGAQIAQADTAPLAFAQSFTPVDPTDQVAAMKRGMNVLGYDPIWRDPSRARFQVKDFTIIKQAGFDSIRLVAHGMDHMDGDNVLDPQWLATLDTMLTAATAAGLQVSLDLHYGDKCGTDVPSCAAKVNAFWAQIAPHYQNAPASVMFEILNEPHGMLNAQAWDGIYRGALATIRATNPTRNVVIGAAGWSSIDQLKTLALPEDDRHIIVTVHYYWPMTFTHQGARWVKNTANLSGIAWGSDTERKKVQTDFDSVKAWADANHRPIFLGEFGAYDRGGSDIESRMRWDSAIAREAEARGFAWAYWQFDSDFVAYDIAADKWVVPVLYALVPPADTTGNMGAHQ